MSGSGRASKSGLGYEVEKKMEQVRSMTHDQLNVLFRIIFYYWNAFFFFFFFLSADDYEAYLTAYKLSFVFIKMRVWNNSFKDMAWPSAVIKRVLNKNSVMLLLTNNTKEWCPILSIIKLISF